MNLHTSCVYTVLKAAKYLPCLSLSLCSCFLFVVAV